MKTFIILNKTNRRVLPEKFQSDDNRNPENLVEYFLEQYTKKGDTIIDIFAGLGTMLFVAEELERLVDRHGQHVRDGRALVLNLERLAVEPFAPTHFAGDEDIGEEVHLNADDAVALTGLAAPPLDVEGEASRLVPPRLGIGQL